jgi:hypothetical protein
LLLLGKRGQDQPAWRLNDPVSVFRLASRMKLSKDEFQYSSYGGKISFFFPRLIDDGRLTIGWNFCLFHSPSLPSAVLALLQGESFYLLHYYNSSGAGILEENFKNLKS